MPLRRKRDVSAANRARQHKLEDIQHNGITPYLKQFIESNLINGISKDTIKRRTSALRRFILWCDERDLTEPQEVTKPILERYKRYLYYYRKTDGDPLITGA